MLSNKIYTEKDLLGQAASWQLWKRNLSFKEEVNSKDLSSKYLYSWPISVDKLCGISCQLGVRQLLEPWSLPYL